MGGMDENPYQSPESPPAGQPGVRLALPSTAARVFSMILICLGTGFAALALLIISEIVRLKLGAISIFEEPPVPTWMALISSTLATSLIGTGIFIRRKSSRKRTQLMEPS